jgi:superfamily II DNA or RNA helicase
VPFEVWVNGAEQPRGIGAMAKTLSMDMRANDAAWLKLKLDNVADQIRMAELVKTGHRVTPRTFVINVGVQEALKKVRRVASDFDMNAVAEIMDKSPVTDQVISHWKDKAGERQTVVFCSTVEHASEVAERFRTDGVPAGTVTGSTPDDVRARTLAEFRAGELRVLTNVHVLTEGWDDPGCAVAILARSCDAASTYLQAVGRVLRPAPGKDHAVLVDLAGVVEKHGLPDADRIYALTGRAISSTGQSLRQCAVCGAVFTSATCPEGCVSAVPPRVIVEQRLDTVAAPTRTFATEYELALVAKLSGYCQVCRSGYGPGTQIMYRRGRRFHPHRACWRPGWEAAV